MRKVVVTEFVSLDGIFEDPGGAEGYIHGGWSMAYWGDDISKFKFDELFASDATLLGRVTYDGFAKAWPGMQPAKPEDNPFADRMNGLPKYVVSSTLQRADWNNSTIIRPAKLADEINKLKQQPGMDILIHGSGTLVHSLRQAGLIDEYHLLVYPVVLGTGKRLLHDDRTNLKLVESKPFSSGVVALTYQPSLTRQWRAAP
jgi:dihydrofolate reductase